MKKICFLVLGCLPALLFAQRTLVYCGKLIDPKAGQVLTEMSIIVTGNTVTAVEKGYVPAASGEGVEAREMTARPSHPAWKNRLSQPPTLAQSFGACREAMAASARSGVRGPSRRVTIRASA